MQKRKYISALSAALIATTLPATAGPWMREAGTRFLSSGGTLEYTPDTALQEQGYDVYFEAGHSPKLTYGAEINGKIGGATTALAFIQKPIGDAANALRMSYQIGLGAGQQSGQWTPLVKATFHMGKGVDTRFGNGWMALEASYLHDAGRSLGLGKLNGTFGIDRTPRLKTMLHLRFDKASKSTAGFAVAPAVAWEMKQGQHLTFEVEARRADQTRLGVKIGLWRSF